jgi:hypothetical protein
LAEVNSVPAEEAFLGEVVVTHLGDPNQPMKIFASGRRNPPIRVIPAQAILRVGDPAGPGAESRFIVLASHQVSETQVYVESEDDNPFDVSGPELSQTGVGQWVFSVRWKKAKALTEGIYNLRVGDRLSPTNNVTVPIMVTKEGSR